MLRITTPLWCFAPSPVARSTAFAHFTFGLRSSVYATHKKNTLRGASSFWSFTAIFRFAEQLRCGTPCLNGRFYPALMVYASPPLLCNSTLLRCFAPWRTAMAKTKARLKCKRLSGLFVLVGVARLELAASWSRTKRATKLRYTPFSVLAD